LELEAANRRTKPVKQEVRRMRWRRRKGNVVVVVVAFT